MEAEHQPEDRRPWIVTDTDGCIRIEMARSVLDLHLEPGDSVFVGNEETGYWTETLDRMKEDNQGG